MTQNDAPQSDVQSDIWSEWLLRHRYGNDATYADSVRRAVERCADRVLDGAQLGPNKTLADIGTGDGAVALRALQRIGPTLQVIQTDISASLLRHAESLAERQRVRSQCTFHRCSAEDLQPIAETSVDAAVTRAVLAYVGHKGKALKELFRILKPGGVLSIAEPIFQDDALATLALKATLDTQPAEARDRFLTLMHRWKSAQFPDTEASMRSTPLTNFSERDLLRWVQAAGFPEAHLELHIDTAYSKVPSWKVFLETSPHPQAPTLGAVMAERFSSDERRFFEQALRPIVENPKSLATDRMAFITAVKPG